MSIFSSILASIFPSSHPSVTAPVTPPAAGADARPTASVTSTTVAVPMVDVAQILTDRAATSGQTLNWRTSIVDLLKLLNLESSLSARKTLATELHYTGDTNDSASMNLWLQKQVMARLAANGGKVPAELL